MASAANGRNDDATGAGYRRQHLVGDRDERQSNPRHVVRETLLLSSGDGEGEPSFTAPSAPVSVTPADVGSS